VRQFLEGPLFRSLACLGVALVVVANAQSSLARGGYHRAAASAPPCGVAAGGLPDPGQTQRCLAERYKPSKPQPGAPSPASNATPPSGQGS
jgi:hypothetical protein